MMPDPVKTRWIRTSSRHWYRSMNGNWLKMHSAYPKTARSNLPPATWITEGPTISSRESTPARQQSHKANYDLTQRIQLTFNERPRIPDEYWFGTNPNCNVLLGHRGVEGTEGVSGRHFCLTFDAQGRVILRDSSAWGTSVSYNGQVGDEVRDHFSWTLSLDVKKWNDNIVYVNKLASHETCKAEYLRMIAGSHCTRVGIRLS
jgi:hypothetical protein